MNILMVHRPDGAFGYITDGLFNAIRDKGHKVQRWDGNIRTWQEFDPDLYIGCSSHKQPIPNKKKCKIAIHVNPYGPVDMGGLNESQENIRWTLAQNPDAVFGYGTNEDRIYWSYWQQKHNIPWVPMPTAADATIFKKLDNVQRVHDFVYLGGRWAYKAKTIDQYLIPLLKNNNRSYKLHGWGDWPNDLCSGRLPEDKVCEFFNSGKIAPCISEMHTHQYGIDIPERAFKTALCGLLVVHDCTVAIKRMIPSALISSSPADFINVCEHYLNNPSEREALADRQRLEVLAHHTYHSRIETLLQALGM